MAVKRKGISMVERAVIASKWRKAGLQAER